MEPMELMAGVTVTMTAMMACMVAGRIIVCDDVSSGRIISCKDVSVGSIILCDDVW